MGLLTNTKRFRVASGPKTKPKGEAKKNSSQIKSREKLDHQIEDESREDKRNGYKNMPYYHRTFFLKESKKPVM